MDSVLLMILLFGSTLVSSTSGACPDIVMREVWGARPAKSISFLSTPVYHVFIHHTAGSFCTSMDSCMKIVKKVQNYHMDNRNWDDIGYNFLVGGDGLVYEGRGWGRAGAHTKSYNSKSIGIAVMGNFQNMEPTDTIMNTLEDLIDCGIGEGYIATSADIHGHKDASCTACPGSNLYEAIKDLPRYKEGRLPDYRC